MGSNVSLNWSQIDSHSSMHGFALPFHRPCMGRQHVVTSQTVAKDHPPPPSFPTCCTSSFLKTQLGWANCRLELVLSFSI